MYKCSNCGQRYKVLPTATYSDGTGKSMTGPTGCDCSVGRNSLEKIEEE